MSGFLLDTSERLETERLYLRCYKAGDGPMYYAASLRNQHHLTEFESDNVLHNTTDCATKEQLLPVGNLRKRSISQLGLDYQRAGLYHMCNN